MTLDYESNFVAGCGDLNGLGEFSVLLSLSLSADLFVLSLS